MPLDESLQAEALRVLDSIDCVCGDYKGREAIFCLGCLPELPSLLRTRVSAAVVGRDTEYIRLWNEACDWLKANTTRLRRPSA
jgi:hypothetical protein